MKPSPVVSKVSFTIAFDYNFSLMHRKRITNYFTMIQTH